MCTYTAVCRCFPQMFSRSIHTWAQASLSTAICQSPIPLLDLASSPLPRYIATTSLAEINTTETHADSQPLLRRNNMQTPRFVDVWVTLLVSAELVIASREGLYDFKKSFHEVLGSSWVLMTTDFPKRKWLLVNFIEYHLLILQVNCKWSTDSNWKLVQREIWKQNNDLKCQCVL